MYLYRFIYTVFVEQYACMLVYFRFTITIRNAFAIWCKEGISSWRISINRVVLLHTDLLLGGGVVGSFFIFCFNLRAALTAGDKGLCLAVGFGFVFFIRYMYFGSFWSHFNLTKGERNRFYLHYILIIIQKNHFALLMVSYF